MMSATMHGALVQELLGLGDHEAEAAARVDLLADDEREHREDHAQLQPGQRLGKRAGEHVCRIISPCAGRGRGRPRRACYRAPNARERVDVHRKQGRQHDEQHLWQLSDAEPDNERRDQSEQRDAAQRLQDRVGGRLAYPAEPGDDREQDGDGAPIARPAAQRSQDTSSDSCSVP